MSKVDYGCYIDTTGMDDETRAKVEKVFVDKFGVSSSGLSRKYGNLLFSENEGCGCYYQSVTDYDEYPVTLEEVLAELPEDKEPFKLKQGDYVDVRGLSLDDKIKIAWLFVEYGANEYSLDNDQYDLWEDDEYIGWDCDGDVYGAKPITDQGWLDTMGLVNKVDTGIILQGVIGASDTVSRFDRNVVFLDYEAKPCNSSMEITITNDEEVTIEIGNHCCFDSVEKGKSKEECVDILKSWSNIINGAIKELEE